MPVLLPATDTLLERPYYKYPTVMEHYGHFTQGYTRAGDIFTLDRPGED